MAQGTRYAIAERPLESERASLEQQSAVTDIVPQIALLLWCAQNLVSTVAVAAYRRGLPQPEIPGVEPSVAIILPVRGAANLARFLPLVRAQAYSRYRIVAAVETADDPAFALLRAAAGEPGPAIETIVAGQAANAGQKVWNQLAALDRLTPDDEIVAFIDADTLPTPLWLPRLVAVIVNSGRAVATGYRWMVPADDSLSSSCLAAANASIASLPRGVAPMTLVWGGSVAMRHETLEAIGLKDVWRGAISDNSQMAEALRRKGLVAHAPRQGLLITPVACSWREFFEFGVRQYRFVFLHQPKNWAAAALCLWAPPVCIALAAPAFLHGSAIAWGALIFVLALGDLRSRLRRSLQRALWPEIVGPRDDRRWRVDRFLRPIWSLAHALCAAGAPLSRRVDWAGIRYRVDGPQAVTVERRARPV